MVKHWYPAAISIALIGCGGSVQDTGAGSSGGQGPQSTGGVDNGVPKAVGGYPTGYYGPFFAMAGNSSVVTDTGGAAATGGVPSINTGVPATGGQNLGVGGYAVIYGVTWAAGGARPSSTGGQGNSTAGTCGTACSTTPSCGDGIVEPPEQCDYGTALNTGDYGGCNPDCTFAPYCGDGVIQDPPERCDYGSANEPPGNARYGSCLTNCTLGPHCGDGIVQDPPEQCDMGSENGPDGPCASVCLINIHM